MSVQKTLGILRMRKLAGRDELIAEDYPVSEEFENISETEWSDLPKQMKAVIEGKKHVLSYGENSFELKPVKTDIDDNGDIDVNKVADYEKDGGDSKKANKKMVDNDKLNEDIGATGTEQRVAADDLLKSKGSKLSLDKEKSPTDHDDEERLRQHEEREARKAKAADLLKNSSLKLEKSDENITTEDDKALYELFTEFPEFKEEFPVLLKNLQEQFENKQDFESDSDAEEYFGHKHPRETKVPVPSDVIKGINAKIKELGAYIDHNEHKEYNDGRKAIDAMERLKEELSSGDYEGLKRAQMFFATLMSPIVNFFPPELVRFLASGPDSDAESGFNKEVEPYESKFSESYAFNREDRFNEYFVDEFLSEAVKNHGYDKEALTKSYRDIVESYQKQGMLPAEAGEWTLPEAVLANPSEHITESTRVFVEYGTNSFDSTNTVVDTLFDADHQYVGLYPIDEDGKSDVKKKAIVEWKGEELAEAVESGMLDPRDWHSSALNYARELGLIKESKKNGIRNALKTKKRVNPCWPGYKQVGMKKGIKGEKEVPNCVPKNGTDDS